MNYYNVAHSIRGHAQGHVLWRLAIYYVAQRWIQKL